MSLLNRLSYSTHCIVCCGVRENLCRSHLNVSKRINPQSEPPLAGNPTDGNAPCTQLSSLPYSSRSFNLKDSCNLSRLATEEKEQRETWKGAGKTRKATVNMNMKSVWALKWLGPALHAFREEKRAFHVTWHIAQETEEKRHDVNLWFSCSRCGDLDDILPGTTDGRRCATLKYTLRFDFQQSAASVCKLCMLCY
ncbi:unnamed protein product [Symbiodinium natans]|uniref:Uncharacterized protein n=1 Tax=Symbiodinium natans TaxID=878477 RepID=A0A812U8W4_9DINO|nr:unnamed protein product [Symbiodinium natans]